MHMIAGTLSCQYSRRAKIGFYNKASPMPDNKPPNPPPAKRKRNGIVQSDAESRSAKKTTSKRPPKQVLPSRQAGGSSDNAELPAGETPFTVSTKKSAIDPKMTVQDRALQLISDAAAASLILILSDINMPGMTGLELLPKAKAARPDVPIIMITAYGDPDTRRKALEGGAEALLTKPIDFVALRSEIDNRVAGAGAEVR
jgi:CheY-like chemotaxis protein